MNLGDPISRRTTIGELLDMMTLNEMGCLRQVIPASDNAPLSAIIIVHGIEESQEVLEAVDKVTKDWA
jgi:hypothetical protein